MGCVTRFGRWHESAFHKLGEQLLDLRSDRQVAESPDHLQALPLPWEVPATQAAQEHGLSLLRCLEPANRLVSSLPGEAFHRLREGACPAAAWPWGHRSGEEVLRLPWGRLMASPAVGQTVRK